MFFFTTDTQIQKFQIEIDKIKTEAEESINKIKTEAEESINKIKTEANEKIAKFLNSQKLLKEVLENMKICNSNSGM